MKYEEDVRARSYKFRDEYVNATPWWYQGWSIKSRLLSRVTLWGL